MHSNAGEVFIQNGVRKNFGMKEKYYFGEKILPARFFAPLPPLSLSLVGDNKVQFHLTPRGEIKISVVHLGLRSETNVSYTHQFAYVSFKMGETGGGRVPVTSYERG